MIALVIPGETKNVFPGVDEGTAVRVRAEIYRIEEGGTKDQIFLKNISFISPSVQSTENSHLLLKLNSNLRENEESIGRTLCVGSTIEAEGVFVLPEAAMNPGGFDEVSYYQGMHIDAIVKKGRILSGDGKCHLVGHAIYQLRQVLRKSIQDVSPPGDDGMLNAILLGIRTDLSPDKKELFQDNGIVHILAISGLHVSILGMGLFRMLRRLRVSYGVSGGICTAMLWFYGALTGFSISAVRAIIMCLLFLGAQLLGRTYDQMTAWVLCASIMLLREPLSIRQPGFLMSYGAVLGVMLGKRLKIGWMNRIGMEAAFGITLVTLPLICRFYYQVPVYSMILNLLVLPLMPYVMISAITSVMAYLCMLPDVGRFLIAPAHYLLQVMEWLCTEFIRLPAAGFVTGSPAVWRLILYTVLCAVFLVFFRKKRKIDLLTGVFGIILLVLVLCCPLPQKWKITFLHVGQGDACCIQTPERVTFMIDGGSSTESGIGKYILEPFLKYSGTGRVDYWLVSHYDQDHISGLLELLQAGEEASQHGYAVPIEIGTVVLPDTGEEDPVKDQILALCAHTQTQVVYAGRGTMITQGDMRLEILHPSREEVYADSNEASMVIHVSYKGFDVLLTGDVEGAAEDTLVRENLVGQIEVLKVAHHGSRNSTSPDFLKKTEPSYSVISCGKDNRYGHPHKELLDRLYAVGSAVVRIDKVGAVTFEVDHNGKYRLYSAG